MLSFCSLTRDEKMHRDSANKKSAHTQSFHRSSSLYLSQAICWTIYHPHTPKNRTKVPYNNFHTPPFFCLRSNQRSMHTKVFKTSPSFITWVWIFLHGLTVMEKRAFSGLGDKRSRSANQRVSLSLNFLKLHLIFSSSRSSSSEARVCKNRRG